MPDSSPGLVQIVATDPGDGCVGCGTQHTVLLHPRHGRQCPDHITLPPGPFRCDLADDMVEMGRPDAALAYLGAWLNVECDRRFQGAAR